MAHGADMDAKMSQKLMMAATPLPPPSYRESSAYHYAKLRPRRLRSGFSVRHLTVVTLGLLLTVQLFWLYLWDSRGGRDQTVLTASQSEDFELGLASCSRNAGPPARLDPLSRRENPRWNSARGQQDTIVLRNVTLFDGLDFLPQPVDVVFSHGLITSVTATGSSTPAAVPADAQEHHLDGAWVTPGLVDMHSHHLVTAWPALESMQDSNEYHESFGPLTPFVNAIDSMKAYDVAATRIASGGVTSSLVIPGSANIMGGEGAVVKNLLRPGPNGEYVVEELLLEHGIDVADRHRYMKMACGENPKGVYGHTRMGNVWILRKWLARAKELIDSQDAWCEAAQSATSTTARASLLAEKGGYPEELELESTAGMLRGRVAMHNHCYEPEDMETMLRVSREFGFRVRAFHHAIAAWQVPEMLKEYGDNITVATFAEFSLYKKEAYAASLYAGKILNDHGVPVAYKSDHVLEDTSAQYLLLQAVVAHSFGLPADKALQSVTSMPAQAIDMDDRIGYVRAGFDADLVVWDAHPLSVGASPKQVYIDGVATLDPQVVEASTARVVTSQASGAQQDARMPAVRATIAEDERLKVCSKSRESNRIFVIKGLKKVFLDDVYGSMSTTSNEDELTLIIDNEEISCLGGEEHCGVTAARIRSRRDDNEIVSIELQNGHLSRGLTAVTSTLGLAEISTDGETGDGWLDVLSPKEAKTSENVGFAKYGVSLAGSSVKAKVFARARLGGITRAIQPPASLGGLIVGVSTGMRTGLQNTLLNGGLFQEDVALHVVLGEPSKATDGAVSLAIEKLRALIKSGSKDSGQGGSDDGDLWASIANGTLPLVVKADSNHDIQHVILLKKDFPAVNAVIFGAHEAHLFAKELAEARVPLILTATRPSPDTWGKKESLPGPPLSRSPADVLSEAGVFFGIALNTDGGPAGDSRIQSLALEASWAAKYAGLTEHEALRLVSTNVEEILGLERSGDIVIWEGNPLHFGTPMLTFQSQAGKLSVASCWPNEVDE